MIFFNQQRKRLESKQLKNVIIKFVASNKVTILVRKKSQLIYDGQVCLNFIKKYVFNSSEI